MSRTRFKSTESRSFLNHPIEYRKIIMNRNNHEVEKNDPNKFKNTDLYKPTESRLEYLLNNHHGSGSKQTPQRKISQSISLSK